MNNVTKSLISTIRRTVLNWKIEKSEEFGWSSYLIIILHPSISPSLLLHRVQCQGYISFDHLK